MYQGKHTSGDSRRAPRKNRRLRWNRQFVLLVSILALLVGIVGSSLAYLITQTGSVENTFQPSRVTCRIDEEFDKATKRNVKVTNTGDTDAYIRAYIVVTWTDDDGNIVAQKPVDGEDYSLVIPTNTGWSKGSDGFYYYASSVAPNGQTGTLIESCSPKGENAQKYKLTVDIIADAVQSKGDSADGKPVVIAWGVTVKDDGTISK